MPVSPPPTPAQLPTSSPLPAVALLLLLLCWALLCLVHLRRVGELFDPKRAAAAIRTQYEQLGPASYPEVTPPVGSGLSVAAQLEDCAPRGRSRRVRGCSTHLTAPRTWREARPSRANLHPWAAVPTVSARQRLDRPPTARHPTARPPTARHPQWRY